METSQTIDNKEQERALRRLIRKLSEESERDGVDLCVYDEAKKFYENNLYLFRDFYVDVGKDFLKNDDNLLPLREKFGLAATQVRVMCKGKTADSLLKIPDPNEPQKESNPLVDALVKKVDDELEEFVRKALKGEIALTDDKLQECMGYIRRKLVLSQLSLVIEANTAGMDIETANLIKIQNQSVRMQLDSLEQTMKALLQDNKGDDLGLEEETASEV